MSPVPCSCITSLVYGQTASVYSTGCNRHNRVKPLHLINNYPLIINKSPSKGRGDGPLKAWRWIMHKVLVKRADPHSANYPGVITSLRNPTHTHTHLRVMVAVFLGLISPSCLCYVLDFPAVFMKERLLLRGPCLQTCRSHFELQINDRCRPPPRQGHSDYQRLRGETDGPLED